MTSRIGEIIVDCADPDRLAAFWCAALGYREFARDATGVAIVGANHAPTMLFIQVPESKAGKNRLHVDVCATDQDQDAELQRLLDLGARRSQRILSGGSWVVLEDPEATSSA